MNVMIIDWYVRFVSVIGVMCVNDIWLDSVVSVISMIVDIVSW